MAAGQTLPRDGVVRATGMAKDSAGLYYLPRGEIREYQGSGGNPNGLISAPIGSKGIDLTKGLTQKGQRWIMKRPSGYEYAIRFPTQVYLHFHPNDLKNEKGLRLNLWYLEQTLGLRTGWTDCDC